MSLSILTPGELEALSHWSIGVLEKAVLPKDGSVNRTVLFETSKGSYALRVCRETKIAREVEQECEVTQFVTTFGLPALTPIHLPNGLPFLTVNHQH